MNSKRFAHVANGNIKAELVLKNAQIINVFSRVIEKADIAIEKGVIVGIGDYAGKREIDVDGYFVAPGFIDGHVHIESSMLTPPQFAKIVMPKGTTSIIADPHEIANVCGVKGIQFMLDSSRNIPLDVFVMVPSCVPASKFETSGATITAQNIAKFKHHPYVLGLGEVMDYPNVIAGDATMHQKIKQMKDRVIDGHAPEVTGKALNAYVASGIKTDHECTSVKETQEKIDRGMYVHLREGSATRNLTTLLGAMTDKNHHRMLFCTDDKHPEDIRKEGHINYNINLAIRCGVDPIVAIQMATINIAQCYGLKRIGAIAPHYFADLVVFSDLYAITPHMVFKKGVCVAQDNEALFQVTSLEDQSIIDTVHIKRDAISFALPLATNRCKVIGLIENNVTTTKLVEEVTVKDGYYLNNPQDDILKLAVVERHHKTGNVGIGLVKGFGLKQGAIAMTIAHDSHNLIIIGDNDEDMMLAMDEIIAINGGIAVVSHHRVLDSLRLEVGGIMTTQDAIIVEEKLKNMEKICRQMGVNGKIDDPFLSLAFLSLTVIPDLKLTDKGLFDVNLFELVKNEEE